MKKQIIMFALASACVHAAEQPVYDCNFCLADAGAIISPQQGVTWTAPTNGAEGFIAIAPAANDFSLPPKQLQPGKKYRLNIRARIDGECTVEKNDRAHINAIKSNARNESVYAAMIDDGTGNLQNAGGGFFLTDAWHDYAHVFYAPTNAKEVVIRFSPRKHATYISRVTLTPDTEDDTVNPNPDFRHGELNYCGWSPQRDGRLYTRPDGKTIFRSGYYGGSPKFPLQPGRKYQITGLGEGGSLVLNYYNDEGKKLGDRFLMHCSSNKEGVTEVVPPEQTVSANVTVTGTILEYLKVKAMP